MKKLKFLGTAILAASLLFAGCSSPVEETAATLPGSGAEDTSGGGGNGGNGGGNGTQANGAYTVTFSDNANSSTYADGVYTISVANANTSEWGNQVFIANPNAGANIAAGDKIHTSLVMEADKAITTMFVKNQFNGGTYSGIDTQKTLPANTATTFDIYGTVANDYDSSSSIVLALRGNEAATTLRIRDIQVEKLGNYAVTSVSVTASSSSLSSGETATLTAKDQYGFVIENASFEITSDSPVSTISGNTLTAGNTAETLTVVARAGEIASAAITITVSTERNYTRYWNTTTTTEGANPPVDYFSIWADRNWTGSTVTLSEMTATANSASLTQTVSGTCWHGTQIWYGLSAASNVSFNVTSTVAGDITVNGTVHTLEANVAKPISLAGVTGKIAIQLGKENPATQLGDCTFSITDFTVTAAE